ncbi:ImmA/IrrE family metallo-endopeptidase [Arcobacter sp. KX21116]|uniref:ImmA/IrrE family metallo-endopeptidase n=1 Tax=Arcobacter iocasae TaxID=2906515 RepID=UPI0035D3E2C3
MKNYAKLKGSRLNAKSLIDILKNSGYNLKLPIEVDEIIKILGISIEKKPDFRKAKVTGSITMKEGIPRVWINPMMNQSKERERFTLAHELGHFMLHIAPSFRDDYISDDNIEWNRDNNWDVKEMEANKFAAELLMPLEQIKEEFNTIDSSDREIKIEKLSEIFKVSRQAIQFRLQSIGV